MSRAQRPECSVQCPGSRVQRPESSIQIPESRVQSPESRVELSEFRAQGPESRVQRRESSVQGPVFRHMFVSQNDTTSYFSVSLKFGACYMGQWGEFKLNTLLYVFIYLFGIFLLLFIINFVLLELSFLFLMKYQISATEYLRIRKRNWWFLTVSGILFHKISVRWNTIFYDLGPFIILKPIPPFLFQFCPLMRKELKLS